MNKIKAICILTVCKKNVKGVITLEEDLKKKETIIKIKIKNLPKGKHGIHIHKAGDLSEGCNSLCSHYNPHNKNHGGPNDKERHVGDLGNIEPNSNGECNITIRDKLVKLRGRYSVLGRSIVIHDSEDDLGKGGNKESLKTGNAGKRIACGIIGYAK